MLQRLKEFAEGEHFDLPPPFYSRRPVRYIIDLDRDGHPLAPVPLDTSEPGSQKTRRGVLVPVPNLARSKGIRPLLLADNAEYTLGLARAASRSDRVASMHAEYADLVARCAVQTGLASVKAVSRFLDRGGVQLPDIKAEFNAGDSITFRVGGKFPVDAPEVQSFWAKEAQGPRARELQCHVCSEVKPVSDRLQKKVKGIPGGLLVGVSISSANAPSFESYGLKKSHVAPTCADCGDKFTEALNHLLSDEEYNMTFPSGKVVLWTKEPTQFKWARILDSPEDDGIAVQIQDLESGLKGSAIDEIPLYGAVLSANGGRAVLRDWIESTVGKVRENLGNWFRSQAIVAPLGNEPRPLGIHALTGATGRSLSDTSMLVTASLVRSALLGTNLPQSLLYHAVRLNRAEGNVTSPRAALIKLVLTAGAGRSLHNAGMTGLDPFSRNRAYLCGRLLYLLEHTQRSAIGGMRSTIVDRYYSMASSTPSPVFRRLLSTGEPYISKLKRQRGAAYRVIEPHLATTLGGLEEFPIRLTLNEQGLFALGYYHQRADLIGEIERRSRRAAKRAAAVSPLAAD